MTPFFLVYFRYYRAGREHGRGIKGGLIVAANHRSFLDPFAIGGILPWRRPMNYVAKVELFEKRWQGWVLSRLGAFPIRRGESDEESMDTARAVVERGGTVCIFPEGTRIRTGSLSTPKRGVGRLALQTGAPVIPTAVLGTEEVRRGWRIRPRKVKVRLGRAMTFPRLGRSLAGPRRDRHLPDLAQRRAAVGGHRRTAADAPRRGDRRRQLGDGGRGAARPRRPRRAARHPHRGTGRRAQRGPRKRALPAGGRAARLVAGAAVRQDRARRNTTSSASRSPPARCRRRSARSPTGSAIAPRSCS